MTDLKFMIVLLNDKNTNGRKSNDKFAPYTGF